MSAADDERNEAFEAGYRFGLDATRVWNVHQGAADAFRAGYDVGRRSVEFELSPWWAKAATEGRALGIEHADHSLPPGLDSTEAAVILTLRQAGPIDRAALAASMQLDRPGLSISRVDSVRKVLQARGLILAARDGRRTLYSEVAA